MSFMPNWNLFGSQKPTYLELQQQRSRQIEQFKLYFGGVHEVQKDTEYKLESNFNGVMFSLLIKLPPSFPQEAPEVRLSPTARHPWLNDSGLVTGCPGLHGFNINSKLEKVIKEIIEEFNRNPPLLVHAGLHPQMLKPYDRPYEPRAPGASTQSGSPVPVKSVGTLSHMSAVTRHHAADSTAVYGPLAVTAGSRLSASNTGSARSVTHQASSRIPTANTWNLHQPHNAEYYTHASAASEPGGPRASANTNTPAGRFSNLSEKELQQLLENDEELVRMAKDMPEIMAVEEEQRTYYARNEELAKLNLSLKPVLEEKKRVLLEKYEQLNDARRKFDENYEQQEQLRQLYDPSLLIDTLAYAAADAEREAERQAESFLEGTSDADTFNKQFMRLQMLKYQRKAYEEKLVQLVRSTAGAE